MLGGRSTMMIRDGARRQRGAALMEILVSILITSFGLLALAGLQSKMNAALMESYQRAQALTLVQDMTQRLQANRDQSASYVTAAVGTGDAAPVSCVAAGTRAQIDLCEWSNALKGAAEKVTATDTNIGAMIGARGCVEQLQAPNPAVGICQPGKYRLSVVWQGMNSTVAPAVTCGQNQYGDETLRKAVSTQVVIPLPTCS
jgi:type IV pilus assembly protein PilV